MKICLNTVLQLSLLLSGRAALCCTMPCLPFIQDAEGLEWTLQEIFLSKVFSAPYFVSGLTSLNKTSHNQIDI